jgi:hypothetical protein
MCLFRRHASALPYLVAVSINAGLTCAARKLIIFFTKWRNNSIERVICPLIEKPITLHILNITNHIFINENAAGMAWAVVGRSDIRLSSRPPCYGCKGVPSAIFHADPLALGRWDARHDIVGCQELVLGKELGFGERDGGQERTPFKDQARRPAHFRRRSPRHGRVPGDRRPCCPDRTSGCRSPGRRRSAVWSLESPL